MRAFGEGWSGSAVTTALISKLFISVESSQSFYSVYQAAKAIATDCCNITLADLASPELVTDEAFQLIICALLMAKYGDVVLNLEKWRDKGRATDMAQQEELVLWIDRRWKNAIEKHLNGETLQEHLENVLDELCDQLPEREYERISHEIQSESAARRAAEEAARTYAAYHVTEHGQEWYFKTSPGEELLEAGKKLRSYITKGNGAMPDKFIGMFFGGQPITAKEFDALTALRMENTGKVRGVFDVNFDKREFSAVNIMDGWQTWAMHDVSVAVIMPPGHSSRLMMIGGASCWTI